MFAQSILDTNVYNVTLVFLSCEYIDIRYVQCEYVCVRIHRVSA